MAHLSDMEELLQNIPNPQISDYMREALQCYNSGAYRGCIVLSCIALFDDSVNKLADIRSFNKKAKEIHDEVVRRQKEQDVFESYLLDQLSANKLISELDSATINTIKSRRNKAAHPSGHKPSAEEARYIYFEVIDKFLSKQSFNSKVLADEIFERIENTGFFPSNQIDDVRSVVTHEIKLLHSDSFPYFLSKLIEGVTSKNTYLTQNSRYFLDGLSSLNHEKWNSIIVAKLLEKKLGDDKYHSQCLAAVSLNPKLIGELSETAMKRLRQSIETNTNKTPNSSSVNSPAQLFENILRHNPSVLKALKNECVQFIKKHSYLSLSPRIASFDDDLWGQYQDILLSEASSSTFDTANNFSKNFKIIEKIVVDNSSDEYLLKLMIGIISAAEWGAWGAESIVSNKFESYPNLKNRVSIFCSNSEAECLKIFEDIKSEIDSVAKFMKRYLEDDKVDA